MDNDTKKMFEIILNKLEDLGQSQEVMKNNLQEMKSGQEVIKEDIQEMKTGQNRIEAKLNLVYEHTAKISEDIIDANMKLNEVMEDIEFLKHKEFKTEKEIFKLKKSLQLSQRI